MLWREAMPQPTQQTSQRWIVVRTFEEFVGCIIPRNHPWRHHNDISVEVVARILLHKIFHRVPHTNLSMTYSTHTRARARSSHHSQHNNSPVNYVNIDNNQTSTIAYCGNQQYRTAYCALPVHGPIISS